MLTWSQREKCMREPVWRSVSKWGLVGAGRRTVVAVIISAMLMASRILNFMARKGEISRQVRRRIRARNRRYLHSVRDKEEQMYSGQLTVSQKKRRYGDPHFETCSFSG